jgi:RimJ/RimL family protein N-acetyltransferase
MLGMKAKPHESLSTDRLDLPPLSVAHTEAMARIYADPEVARYVGGDRLTPEIIALQVADFAQEWDTRGYGQSAVLRRDTGAFIGRIGLHYWPEWAEVELGYILSRDAQGQGWLPKVVGRGSNTHATPA